MMGGSIATYATNNAGPSIPFWQMVFKNIQVFFLGSDDFPAAAKTAAAGDINAALRRGGKDSPSASASRCLRLLRHTNSPSTQYVQDELWSRCEAKNRTGELAHATVIYNDIDFGFNGIREASVSELAPAQQLAATNQANFPHESADYRAARNALLVEEIELRRHIERVAAQRRALPPGGPISKDFELTSETGPARFSSLFGDKDTLMVYSMMYGPQRKTPCPMCTSFLSAWNGTAVNLRERVAIAVTARSPIERLIEYKRQRGFSDLPFVSDAGGEYTRTYVNAGDEDVPGYSVFTRRNGAICHFYSGEMSLAMADPGQDPRGAPDLDPLWLMMDLTPEGRGADWYPKLEYTRG